MQKSNDIALSSHECNLQISPQQQSGPTGQNLPSSEHTKASSQGPSFSMNYGNEFSPV